MQPIEDCVIYSNSLNSNASSTSSGRSRPQRLTPSTSNNVKVCLQGDHENAKSCIPREAHNGFIESHSKDNCRGNKYKGSDCGFVGRTNWHLLRHSAVHGDGFRYSCSVPRCGCQTNQTDSLKDHQERRHAGVFPDLGTDATATVTTEDTGMRTEEPETVAEATPVAREEPNVASDELCCDFLFGSLDIAFACMLCRFVGNSREAARVHAATHNPTA